MPLVLIQHPCRPYAAQLQCEAGSQLNPMAELRVTSHTGRKKEKSLVRLNLPPNCLQSQRVSLLSVSHSPFLSLRGKHVHPLPALASLSPLSPPPSQHTSQPHAYPSKSTDKFTGRLERTHANTNASFGSYFLAICIFWIPFPLMQRHISLGCATFYL